nr:hypothetical protein [Tanacetum cinerariifolium]
MPHLKDIYASPSEGIFTDSSYDDEGVVTNFNNLETTVNEEPKRLHQALKDPSWIKAMQKEILQFNMQKVWVLVDLVYGKRAIGFEDPDHPDKVYKVVKALYGLHQAPRAWYETLATYLLENISFEKLMKDKFQMSSIGELTFVLGLQVKQKKDGIFISQDEYVAKILRKFRLTKGKSASTPIDTEKPLLKDSDGEDKKIVVSTSSTEAEYVAAASCFAQ